MRVEDGTLRLAWCKRTRAGEVGRHSVCVAMRWPTCAGHAAALARDACRVTLSAAALAELRAGGVEGSSQPSASPRHKRIEQTCCPLAHTLAAAIAAAADA